MTTECVEAPPGKRRTPRNIVLLVTPVAANITSPEARSSSLYLRSRSATPMRWAPAAPVGVAKKHPPFNFPADASQRSRRQYSFRRTARTDIHINAGLRLGG